MKTSKLPGRLPVRPSVSISTFTYITDLYYYNLPPALAASAPHWHTRNTRSSASIPLPAHKKGGMEKTNLSLPATPIILNSAQSLAASTHRPLPVPPDPSSRPKCIFSLHPKPHERLARTALLRTSAHALTKSVHTGQPHRPCAQSMIGEPSFLSRCGARNVIEAEYQLRFRPNQALACGIVGEKEIAEKRPSLWDAGKHSLSKTRTGNPNIQVNAGCLACQIKRNPLIVASSPVDVN